MATKVGRVKPIRIKKQIDTLKKYLRGKNIRDSLLFVLGISSGLRISDLLKLRVEEVYNQDRISIREQKILYLYSFENSLKYLKKAEREFIQNSLK